MQILSANSFFHCVSRFRPKLGASTLHTIFPVIKTRHDVHTPHYKESNMILYNAALQTRQNLLQSSSKMDSKKLTVQQRISLLKDEGAPILYLSITAGLNLPYGSVKNGGGINAITKIMGNYVLITGNDWTFKGGTSFPITVKKQLRAQEIALQNRLPCIYLVDSGGAFLPLQVCSVSKFTFVRYLCVHPFSHYEDNCFDEICLDTQQE